MSHMSCSRLERSEVSSSNIALKGLEWLAYVHTKKVTQTVTKISSICSISVQEYEIQNYPKAHMYSHPVPHTSGMRTYWTMKGKKLRLQQNTDKRSVSVLTVSWVEIEKVYQNFITEHSKPGTCIHASQVCNARSPLSLLLLVFIFS